MNKLCQECGGACCELMLLRAAPNVAVTLDGASWLAAHDTKLEEVFGHLSYIIEHKCKFLTTDGRCAIYPSRPGTCQRMLVDGVLCKWVRERRERCLT